MSEKTTKDVSIMEKIKARLRHDWAKTNKSIFSIKEEDKIAFVYASDESPIDYAVIARREKDGSLNCTMKTFNKGVVFADGEIKTEILNTPDESIGVLCKLADNEFSKLIVDTYVDKLPESIKNKAPYDKLIASKKAEIEDQIFSHLNIDREAIDVIKYSYNPTERAYRYYSDKSDDLVHRYRMQAGQTYPVLATFLAERLSLRHAIDMSEPLLPALMASTGKNSNGNDIFSKAMLKRLVNKKYYVKDITTESLLCILSETKADWFPKDEEGWNAFCDIASTLGEKFNFIDTDTLYKSCGGDWLGFKRRIASAYADKRPPEGATEHDIEYLKTSISFDALSKLPYKEARETIKMIASKLPLPENITQESLEEYLYNTIAADDSRQVLQDACHDFDSLATLMKNKIITPTIAYASELNNPNLSFGSNIKTIELANDILTNGKSLINIIETVRSGTNNNINLSRNLIPETVKNKDTTEDEKSFHPLTKEDIEIMKKLHAWDGNVEFPIACRPVMIMDNVFIVPLLSANQLSIEGETMKHCVGDNYVSKAMSGSSYILSVRTIADNGVVKHSSTIEMSYSENKNPRMKQHRGYNNTTKFSSASISAREWLRHNKDSYMSLSNIKTSIEVKLSGDVIKDKCGYDWKNKNNIQEMMKDWGALISKKYRVNFDKFISLPAVQEISEEMNPQLARKRKKENMIPAFS